MFTAIGEAVDEVGFITTVFGPCWAKLLSGMELAAHVQEWVTVL